MIRKNIYYSQNFQGKESKNITFPFRNEMCNVYGISIFFYQTLMAISGKNMSRNLHRSNSSVIIQTTIINVSINIDDIVLLSEIMNMFYSNTSKEA